MKLETLLKIEAAIKTGKIVFADDLDGLAVEFTLTAREIQDIVEAEYSHTSQNINDLFEVILNKLVKESLSYAKNNPNKLSDL